MNKLKKLLQAFIVASFLLIGVIAYGANITSISSVSITPSNPAPGDTVSVSWTYTLDSAYNSPASLVVVSDQCALRNATPNQIVLIGNACASGGTQVSGGCILGTKPSGINTETRSIIIPATLTPGFTYYIAVGMKDYGCYMSPGLDVQVQNCISFTVPLPPPYIKLTKIAEGSSATAGGKVLYTIAYDVANTNNVIISDVIPSDMTFVEAYDGGTYSAGTVSWNLGNITSPAKGSLSFLVQVKVGTAAGTLIHNTASATSSGATAVSKDAIVTIGAALKIAKLAKPSTVAVGQTITYSINYSNEGYALNEYVNFDSAADILGWDKWSSGASVPNWQVTNGYLEQSVNAQNVDWPSIAKPTPLLHDAMYITDLYIPNENFAQDTVFKFNVIDHTNWYQAVIQSDNNSITLQKDAGAGVVTPAGGSKNYPGGYIVNDTWYTLKVQVSGSNIKLKCWRRDSTEPTYWDVNTTDTTLSAPGTAGYQANQGDARADNLKIFDPVPATHLRIWDTLPACVTFVGCDQGCTSSGGTVTWDFPGVQGNTLNTVSFWVTADLCSNNSVVNNQALIDSDEPAPEVISEKATVIVGAMDSPTSTPTKTSTPSLTASPTSTRTASPTVTNTALGTFTDTPTITITSTYSATATITPTITPAPAEIQLTFTAVDPATSVGGYAEFKITVKNAGTAIGSLSLSEIIPADVTFEESPSDAGGNSGWVYSGGTINRVLTQTEIDLINAGGIINYYFTVKTSETLSSGDTIVFSPIDGLYNDQIYTAAHAFSLPALLTVGDIVVYPNPFNPGKAVDNVLKFANLPRGTQISIYTLNGEQVISFWAQSSFVKWDAKNAYGKAVSQGIYYYVLKYNNGKTKMTGKIFVVKD